MIGPISQSEWAELRRASASVPPTVIEKVGLPAVLLPYQQFAVSLAETVARVLIIEKSRRIGLTWALASLAVLRAGRARGAGGMDAMYISYSQEMTREFVDACAMWARAFNTAAMAAEEFLLTAIIRSTPSASALPLGSRSWRRRRRREPCAASRASSSSTKRPSSNR
ncbi:MAG TPA: hypothetical protein VIJ42_09305 [Stellaceae bacterium]